MPTPDPWFWTVEDLVSQLCQTMAPFVDAGCDPRRYPDVAQLERQLRSSNMTGAHFLTKVDEDELRTSFQLNIPGPGSTVLNVISHLRSKSAMYGQRNATTGVQALSLDTESRVHENDRNGSIQYADVDGRRRRRLEPVTITQMPGAASPDANTRTADGVNAGPVLVMLRQPEKNSKEVDWSYLQHWQHDDTGSSEHHEDIDDVMVDFDAEDDEQDENEDEEIVEAKDVEPEDIAAGDPGRLPPSRVTEIINNEIDTYEDQWYPGLGWTEDEPLASDAFELWHEAESVNERPMLVEASRQEAEYYKQKLHELCDEISSQHWKSEKALRLQCRILQETIAVLKQEEWELEVYQQPLPPQCRSHDRDDTVADVVQPAPAPRQSPAQQIPRAVQPARTGGLEKEPIVIDLDSDSDSSHPVTQDDTPVDGDIPMPTPPQIPRTPRTPNTSNITPNRPKPGSSSKSKTPDRIINHSQRALNSLLQSRSPSSSQVRPTDYPEHASIATIRTWTWPDLLSTADRKRIMLKVLQEMAPSNLETIRTRMETIKKKDLVTEITSCVTMFQRGEKRLPGVLPRDVPNIMKLSNLFLSWWFAENYFQHIEDTEQKKPSPQELAELKGCLEAGTKDMDIFYDWVRYILAHTFSMEALRQPNMPSQAEIVVISSDEEGGDGGGKGEKGRATMKGVPRTPGVTLGRKSMPMKGSRN